MRSALLVLFLPLLASAWAGCGQPRAPGGSGRLDHAEGRPDRLVVAGSPHEMGWWHGHLLRDRILERVGFARQLQPAEYLDLFVDQAKMRLSERLRQELEGMAVATGAELDDLLRIDVARDGLRFRGGADLAEGTGGLAPVDGGFEARMRYSGPGAPGLARHAVLIHRKPTGRPASLALARPGSLGGWAAVTADGRGYLLAEVEIRNRARLGFGGGRPFVVMAREALTASSDVEQLAAEMTGTMGHIGIGVSVHPGELPMVRALAGVQVYGAPDPPWALAERRFLAIGAHADPAGPEARALQAQVVAPPDLSLDERWLRLAALGPTEPDGGAPQVILRWRGGRASMIWQPGGGAEAREVTLDGVDR